MARARHVMATYMHWTVDSVPQLLLQGAVRGVGFVVNNASMVYSVGLDGKLVLQVGWQCQHLPRMQGYPPPSSTISVALSWVRY